MDYFGQLILKNFIELINFIGNFIVNLKGIDQRELLNQIQSTREKMEEVKQWDL